MFKIVKIHVGEELNLTGTDINVKYVSYKVSGGGKETEEFGEIHNVEFLFTKAEQQQKISYGWADVTSENRRFFDVFGYRILHLDDSDQPFSKKEQKDWISLLAHKMKENEIFNHNSIRVAYFKKII